MVKAEFVQFGVADEDYIYPLGKTQVDVLGFVAMGMSLEQTAQALNISRYTVRNSLFSNTEKFMGACARLGAVSLVHAALIALDRGMLRLEGLTQDYDFSRFADLETPDIDILQELVRDNGVASRNMQIAERLKMPLQKVRNRLSSISTRLDPDRRMNRVRMAVLFRAWQEQARESGGVVFSGMSSSG